MIRVAFVLIGFGMALLVAGVAGMIAWPHAGTTEIVGVAAVAAAVGIAVGVIIAGKLER